MRKIKTYASMLLIIALFGCTGEEQGSIDETKLPTELVDSESNTEQNNKITFAAIDTFEFDFPGDWKLNRDETAFDLQCFSRTEDLTTGIFVFNEIDLAENSVAEDYLELQVDDIRSKRENFEFVEEVINTNIDGKRIKMSVYSGEKDGVKNYYIYSLVDFDDYDSFAVILQTCIPSDWEKNHLVLEEIVKSCRPID